MVRLVSIDPNLLVHKDERIRHRTWAQVLYNCGWRKGNVLAEIPNLRKLICQIPDGNSSNDFQKFILRTRQKRQSLQIGNLDGDSWRERALSTSLMDFLLTCKSDQYPPNPKVWNIDQFFDDSPNEPDQYSLKDPRLLKSLDLLVVGSRRIDVIDKYQPLYDLNPIFEHWIQVFREKGEYHRHLVGRPKLVIHVAHKDSDSSRLTIQPDNSAMDLLRRMKARGGSSAEPLMKIFEVSFSVWEPKALHSRFVLGDLGGLHLGESLNESGLVTVTHLSDHLGIRHDFDTKAQNGENFVRELKVF